MSETTNNAEENVLLIAPAPEENPEAVKEEVPQETMAILTTGAEDISAEAKPTVLDNVLTIGMVAALAVAVLVMVIRKLTAKKKPAPDTVETGVPDGPGSEPADIPAGPVAPGAAGEVKLNNVEPKTAAMLMAIVADKMQKPINELRFISIKEVE